jgi:hypothetical protein
VSMTNEEIFAWQRARRAHLAAVPGALGAAKDALKIVPPGAGQVITLSHSTLNTLVAEIERLQALVKQQNQDAMEAQREFQRDAGAIAAEARWQAIEETRGGGY